MNPWIHGNNSITLSLWLTVCHGFSMAHRNRWFTVLKNDGSFHGKLLNYQMVVDNQCHFCHVPFFEGRPVDPAGAIRSSRLPKYAGRFKTLVCCQNGPSWDVDESIVGPTHIPWRIHGAARLMVLHGSHQYTPFMLALIYQHHGSVMG